MLDRTVDATRPAETAGLVELAPAKINLALHVVGQRADGYHLLDSIVTFASEGDRIHIEPAQADSFRLSGRFAAHLAQNEAEGQKNLVLKARDRLRSALREQDKAAPPVAIHLEKNLPVASGIGGGSADAAATLRGLSRFWNSAPEDDALTAIALGLGADVPMCLASQPLLARGIGEEITLLPDLPSFAMVLGNPLVSVSTPEIFRNLSRKDNEAMPIQAGGWARHLALLRNDLEPVARDLLAEIGALSQMITAQGAWLTRMSGSGATCFGLFDTQDQAVHAANALKRQQPDWYFVATTTIGAAP
jgi:4-diphosphocytidyl-2-C-methyl-D-erythritol kinase